MNQHELDVLELGARVADHVAAMRHGDELYRLRALSRWITPRRKRSRRGS